MSRPAEPPSTVARPSKPFFPTSRRFVIAVITAAMVFLLVVVAAGAVLAPKLMRLSNAHVEPVLAALRQAHPEIFPVSVTIDFKTRSEERDIAVNVPGALWSDLSESEREEQAKRLAIVAYEAYPEPEVIAQVTIKFDGSVQSGPLKRSKSFSHVFHWSDLEKE